MKTNIIIAIAATALLSHTYGADYIRVPIPQFRGKDAFTNSPTAPMPPPRFVPQPYGYGNKYGGTAGVIVPGPKATITGDITATKDGKILGVGVGVTVTK